MTLQIKDWKYLIVTGTIIVSILALQAQALFADSISTGTNSRAKQVSAYTDLSSQPAQDILWLARILYSETKVREEQIVIAWVVRNRVESEYRGADSYHEVATDPKQFSGIKPASDLDYSDTKYKSWQDSIAIARAVYFADETLRPISASVRHFYSPEAVMKNPKWAIGKKPTLTLRDPDGSVRFAFYDSVR